jgi:hypothetical protein
MISAGLFILSVVLVVLTAALAITVSPVYFLALLLSLAIPAFLTIRSYKSPNRRQAAEPAQPAARVSDY